MNFVQPGEKEQERMHNFQGERTRAGRFKERLNRESRGGWFAFDLDVLSVRSNVLVVEYWGGFPGSKTFDILIDGSIIATENISQKKDGQFIFVEYAIPEEMTQGKTRVTVRFQARESSMAGPVFGVRIIPGG